MSVEHSTTNKSNTSFIPRIQSQLQTLSPLFWSLFMIVFALVYAQYHFLTNILTQFLSEKQMILYSLGLVVLTYAFTQYRQQSRIYLIDFSTLRNDQMPKEAVIDHETFIRFNRACGTIQEEGLRFLEKIIKRSGVGQKTAFPPHILQPEPDTSMEAARREFDFVMTSCLNDLFKRTKVKPEEIDLLIVNCSLFNPTPSLAAMIMNKFKFKPNCKHYNLSGMGCSAGVISLDLARDLLKQYPNSNCLVFSTENITQNWYRGNEKSMLLSNCLFRMGGAAVLLSNRPENAKYELLHTVRVSHAGNEEAYQAVYQTEDLEGRVGVRLSKQLMSVVSDALKQNLTRLGPLILPWYEQLMFLYHQIRRQLNPKFQKYSPSFKQAFQHICIHAGGRAVMDGLEQSLNLTKEQVMASRATLFCYGNTSSSSIWYEMAYHEHSGIRKNDVILQIAFGSGFNCNSAVWKALTNIQDQKRGKWDLDGLEEVEHE